MMTSNKFFLNLRASLTLFILLIFLSSANAQLDSLHYLPPIKPKIFNNNSVFEQSEVVLSTPSVMPISVVVTTGDGIPVAGSPYSVVLGTPAIVPLADGANPLAIEDTDAGFVLSDKGFILSSADKFIVSYKAKSNQNNQADMYTSKGTIAKGTEFRWGGFPVTSYGTKNTFLSLMATEDGTTVTITGYDVNCVFRQGLVANSITANSLTINLNQGQTYVLECLSTEAAENLTGAIGASITSNNPIVVNNGHAVGGNNFGNARDLMLEQSVPVSELGTEYISILGNNTPTDINVEQVNIIATQDNTAISVNGGPVIATINAGQYYILFGASYTANENMYIQCSQPAYCYQQLRGAAASNTVGLNLIPPLSCYLPKEIVEIPFIEDNNGLTMTGGIFILTQTGATVLINGALPVTAPQVVTGTPDWVTYKETGLTGNISVTSTHPMAVGAVVTQAAAGSAGYYSGFIEYPDLSTVSVLLAPPSDCLDTLFVGNSFNSYQWLENGVPIVGATDTFYVLGGSGAGMEYSVAVDYGGCLDTSSIVIDCPILLSVEDLLLKGIKYDRWIDLFWTSQSETGNDYFDVMRSFDAQNFEVIGQVDGSGTTTSSAHYSFRDEEPIFGMNYYKVRPVDFNGMSTYSNMIAFQYGGNEEVPFISISPNPATGSTNLLFNADKSGEAVLTLYNAIGQLVYQDYLAVQSGANNQQVDLSSISNGVYLLHLQLSGEAPRQAKIMKNN